MFRQDGRVAIVTGGSRGIGRAVAIALAKQVAHVVVNYAQNEAAAGEVVAAITGAGGKAEAKPEELPFLAKEFESARS